MTPIFKPEVVIGIAIGAVLLLGVIVVTVIVIVFRRRRRLHKQDSENFPNEQGSLLW